jgi:hypothetical protein
MSTEEMMDFLRQEESNISFSTENVIIPPPPRKPVKNGEEEEEEVGPREGKEIFFVLFIIY